MHIYFGTTSKVKLDQYSNIFCDLGIEIKRGMGIKNTIEPQYDASIIQKERWLISHPLRRAAPYVQGQLPYMIEDTILVIDAFSAKNAGASGLPGADTKSWWRNLRAEGVLKLLGNTKNRKARFICQLGVYFGKEIYAYKKAELWGAITYEVQESERAKLEVPRSNPFYFHTIFQPKGWNMSLAEMGGEEFAKVDYRRKCAKQIAIIVKEFDRTGELPEIKQSLLPFEDDEIEQLALPFIN